jgi:N,N'-diacetyllegionaminate synthase
MDRVMKESCDWTAFSGQQENRRPQFFEVPMAQIRIADRVIGPDEPVYVIADIDSNHDGDLGRALALARAAARAGADAVKYQALTAEELFNPLRFDPGHAGEPWPAMAALERLAAPASWWPKIAAVCKETGVHFIATPFSEAQADTLNGLQAIKIASGEMTHYPLLRHVAAKGLPILLSTGASHLDEVKEAVGVLREAGARGLAVLHCVSLYPPKWEEVNLRCVRTLAEALPDAPVGFSDHTPGATAALGAVALGAAIIEKHFTDDPAREGADHRMSMDPAAFREMVNGIRDLKKALGDGKKGPSAGEQAERYYCRRGLWAARDIAKGERIAADAVKVVRPCHGLPASALQDVVGKKAKAAIPRHHSITGENIE